MDDRKTVYVVMYHDFEEKPSRATTVCSVWRDKQRAEEEVCFCYIDNATDAKKDIEEQCGEEEDFYSLLTDEIEDRQGFFFMDQGELN